MTLTIERMIAMEEVGTLVDYVTGVHAAWVAALTVEIEAIQDHPTIGMAVADVTDFLLRWMEDDVITYPEVLTGEDDRHIHYLNRALAAIAHPDGVIAALEAPVAV